MNKSELQLSPIVKVSRWAVLGSMLLGACQEVTPTVSPDPATPTRLPVTETIAPTPTAEKTLESLNFGVGGVNYAGTKAVEPVASGDNAALGVNSGIKSTQNRGLKSPLFSN